MTRQHTWMRYVLIAAALANVSWGLWIAINPAAMFRIAGLAAPLYPEVWHCVGLFIAFWGLGYALAAVDPVRHWPVVAAGLLSKVAAPIGFVEAALRGRFPLNPGWLLIISDVMWWIPFSLILRAAYQSHLSRLRLYAPEVLSFALRTHTDSGPSIDQLSRTNPVLLVFLRHAGCPFCREALADVMAQRKAIERVGTQIVLVHMGEREFGRAFFRKYGLDDVPQISDPHQMLYRAFGLRRGSLRMLFGPTVWFRGFDAGILRGHGVGRLAGDGFQMPGIFLIFHGEILRSFRHQSAADRPDYARFVREHTQLATL